MIVKFKKTTKIKQSRLLVRSVGAVVVGFYLGAGAISAQVKESLPFKAFLEATLKHDPSFKGLLIQRLTLQYANELNVPASDLILDVEAQYGFLVDSGEGGIASGASLSQYFADTGTTLSLTVEQKPEYLQPGGYRSSVGVRLSQSIVQNAFGANNRRIKLKAETTTEIARLQIVEAYEDYLVMLYLIYLEWHLNQNRLAIAEKSYTEDQQVLKLTQRKQRLRVAFAEEVQKSRIALIRDEMILEQVKLSYKQSLIQMAALSGISVAELQNKTSQGITLPKATTKVKDSERTNKILQLFVEAKELDADIAADDLLPSTELFIGYELLSREYNLARPDHHVTFGATFNYNFTNTQSKALRETALLQKKETALKQKSGRIFLKSQYQILELQTAMAGRIAKMAQENLKLAEARAKILQTKFGRGQVNITELATAREDLNTARRELIRWQGVIIQYQLEKLRLSDRLIYKLPK